MKFDVGDTTLATLTGQTTGSADDLGQLVRRLAVAAAPLEGRFRGAGRAAFDAFKADADQVAADLDAALVSILRGQHGMDSSFRAGDEGMAAEATVLAAAAPFDAARFHRA